MTLIANVFVGGCPILLGDLLLSEPAPDAGSLPRIDLPTRHDANRSIPSVLGRVAAGLVQKVVLVNGQLAIAWAGSDLAASAFLRSLSGRSDGQYSTESLMQILREIDFLGKLPLSVLGLLLQRVPDHGSSIVMSFGWDSTTGFQVPIPEVGPFRNVNMFGSGSADFMSAAWSLRTRIAPVEGTMVERALLSTLGLSGAILGEQTRIGAGLAAFWGGGIEMVSIVEGQLKKVGNVTYVFFELEESARGSYTLSIPVVLKLDYVGNVLILRRVGLANAANDHEFVGRDDISIVLRPDQKTPSEPEREALSNLPVPSLESRFSVMYVRRPDRSAPQIKTLVHYCGKQEPAIRFHEEGNGWVTLTIRSETLERIVQMWQ